jgi:hypothetical protein
MLSHSIDKTQRGDEATVCGRLSNYRSGRGNRIPRNARYRRQTEEGPTAAAAADNEEEYTRSSEELPDSAGEGTTLGAVDILHSPEEGNTSKQNAEHDLEQTEEPPETSQEGDKLNSAEQQKTDVEELQKANT